LKGILNGDDEIAATAVLKRGYKKKQMDSRDLNRAAMGLKKRHYEMGFFKAVSYKQLRVVVLNFPPHE